MNMSKPLLRKMHHEWFCCFPPKSTMMGQVISAFGETPIEAHTKVMNLLRQRIEDPFIPPPPIPKALSDRYQDAEARINIGGGVPWSSLDTAIRNGGQFN